MSVRKFIDETGLTLLNTLLTNKFATKYEKLSTGIPKSDLSSDVQASLGKADTALQTEQYTGTYSKPSGGIPKTDLASAVQTSLGKADTALQSHLTAGTGISISNNAISVSYGTTASTACVGNDSRLSNSRTPTSHASTATTYGIGTTANYGHCMTINNLTTSAHADGKALSAYQGYVLNQKIKYGTSDYTAGTTALTTGSIYCVYE